MTSLNKPQVEAYEKLFVPVKVQSIFWMTSVGDQRKIVWIRNQQFRIHTVFCKPHRGLTKN